MYDIKLKMSNSIKLSKDKNKKLVRDVIELLELIYIYVIFFI